MVASQFSDANEKPMSSMPAIMKNRPMLSVEAARLAAQTTLDSARRRGLKLAVAVVDEGARLVYFERMDEVSFGSGAVALGKAESAAAYRRGTEVFDQRLTGGRMAVLGQPHAFPIEGGVPLLVDGYCVGAIGASGALAADDTAMCRDGAAALAQACVDAETGGSHATA
jgi:glc operon protein GlcG